MVILIQEGKVRPSMLLRKLTTYSKKIVSIKRSTRWERSSALKFISDGKLREIIYRSTNKTEQYNNFEDCITFTAGNMLLDRTFPAVEKRVKYTGVLANCVMLDNVIELNAALNTLANEGLIPSIDELVALSPYQTRHLKRFGNYELDLEQIPAPETSDLTFEVEQESRVPVHDSTVSRLPGQSEESSLAQLG